VSARGDRRAFGRLLAALIAGGAALALAAPFLFPSTAAQMAFLCIMIVFALTWDTMGGQMGYNSFGNILFFGIGMYACAVVQRDLGLGYFPALALGLAAAAAVAVVVAAVLGAGMLALRGHYFAIGTLGLGIAAGEIAASWQFVGAGSGMVTPLYPGDIAFRTTFFYYLCLALAALTFLSLRALYRTRFGLALNAIRDDEDKAEAMGLRTTRYKTLAWCVSAFFLAIAGGLVGNIIGFIDPHDTAFAGETYGVWMVLMAILGGKGTLLGPVIGAVIFHVTQEVFWTYLLGWQRVALGLLIVLIVVFFPQGVLGWARERWPARFGAGPGEAGGGAAAERVG
jgi:branched-chain amino acid transport system permease protein